MAKTYVGIVDATLCIGLPVRRRSQKVKHSKPGPGRMLPHPH